MIKLTLYTTAGCHLCEQAEQLIKSISLQNKLVLTLVEIGDDESLVAQYGVHIPVVKFADDAELNWPFSLKDIVSKFAILTPENLINFKE